MCLKRDLDDNCEMLLQRFRILDDTIDLTLDDLGDDDFVEIIPRFDPRNYPYNLLPSSDEEDLWRSYTVNLENINTDVFFAGPGTTHDSFNEINQNADTSNAQSASVNINFNISETNNTNQSNEEREFELNIPQILLSMSRISNNLYNQTSESRD